MLVYANIEVITLLLALGDLQALLWGLGLVGDGTSIHGTHVVNNVHPLSPQNLYQQAPLLFPLLCWLCLLFFCFCCDLLAICC